MESQTAKIENVHNIQEFTRRGKEIRQRLLDERTGRICCYCECLLTENDSHIEHFWPKEHFPDRALDYQNMMCSCMNERQKGLPLHCGHLKDDWYDPQMPCPLDPATQERFFVEGNGNIRKAIIQSGKR